MSQLTIYPRLYTSRSAMSEGAVISRGDETLITLMELHLNKRMNTTAWPFRRQVIDTALRLFGDFNQWLNDQRRNPTIVGYNRDFVNDTLQYLQTGRRELSVQNWLELVEDDSQLPAGAAHKHLAALAGSTSTNGNNTIQILQRWCSLPDGIEDLLFTMYILFGSARPARAAASLLAHHH